MDITTVLPLLKSVISPAVEISAAGLIKEMLDYWVWEIHTHTPDLHLVVKLAGPRAIYTSAFEQTAALYRLVAPRVSFPLPEILAADESCQKWPWRYFIKTYLPGEVWATVVKATEAAKEVPPGGLRAAGLRTAFADLGRAVAELHQIRFPSFGELDFSGGFIRPAPVLQPLPFVETLAQRIRRMVPAPEPQDYLLSLLAARASLFQEVREPTLCHEDLHHYNILLDKSAGAWRLATILDFEKTWAGHPEIDLARMELWGMTRPPFWEVYQQRCPVDPGYAERKLIYQLIWCVEFAENTARHLEDTRRLCRALGLPIIESFAPFRVKIG